MTEQLLDCPKICATLEQMRGRGVPEPVRPQIRCARHVTQQLVNRAADLAWVNPATASAQE